MAAVCAKTSSVPDVLGCHDQPEPVRVEDRHERDDEDVDRGHSFAEVGAAGGGVECGRNHLGEASGILPFLPKVEDDRAENRPFNCRRTDQSDQLTMVMSTTTAARSVRR